MDHVYRQLLQNPQAPAAVLINRKNEILHLFGPIGSSWRSPAANRRAIYLIWQNWAFASACVMC